MLCLILYLDKKQSIAVAIGVANLTVGGCVCAGKMKNILLKHKEQFRKGEVNWIKKRDIINVVDALL